MVGGVHSLCGFPAEMSGAATLAEIGITRDQSSQWQRLASDPHAFIL
jgi:hypothetical protein